MTLNASNTLKFGLDSNRKLTGPERDEIAFSIHDTLEELRAQREKDGEKPFGVSVWRYDPASGSPVIKLRITPPDNPDARDEIKALLSPDLFQSIFDRWYKTATKEPKVSIDFKPLDFCCWWENRNKPDHILCTGCSVPERDSHTKPEPIDLFA